MKSRRALSCLLVMAITAAPSPVMAQGPLVVPEAEVLWGIGTWLVSYITGKAVDPFVDRVLGRDTEKKLQAVAASLKNQIDRGAANGKQLEEQLKVAKDELRMLRQLMAGAPSAKQLEHDRKELASDLKTIRSTLAEHERKLAELDQRAAAQDDKIESQGRKLKEMEQRLGVQQSPSPSQGPLSPPAPGESLRPLSIPLQPGATLMIQVKGRANLIRLREATHPVLMGTFRLSRDGMAAAYFLPPAVRAVVELFAPANRISMPARLAHQVQILSHGWYYETLLY
jgi:hypothetical protein